MSVFFPQSMSFEAHSLTVPSVMWLGLLPSDLQRFGITICYFLFPPPASNWNYIQRTFKLFVLVSVAVYLFFSPQGTALETIWHFKYTSVSTNLGEKKLFEMHLIVVCVFFLFPFTDLISYFVLYKCRNVWQKK